VNVSWAGGLCYDRQRMRYLRARPYDHISQSVGQSQVELAAGVALAVPGKVKVSIEMVSALPVDLVELLVNGKVLARRPI